MTGNLSIHLAILLTTFSGLAEREFEKLRSVDEFSENTARPGDGLENRDTSTAAESEVAKPTSTTGQHKEFEPFAGTFKAEVKLWMGPGNPMVSTGVMANTLVLGGRYLQQTFKGDPSPESEGHGFWGFNQATSKYEGFWIDARSTKMQIEVGHVDDTGRVWTMVGEITGPRGNTMKKRSVITLEDKDHHKVEMFFTRPDGSEVKVVEISYERK